MNEDEEEKWRDIAGYEGMYQISNLGRVKSLERQMKLNLNKDKNMIKKEKILKPGKTGIRHNYLGVELLKKSKQKHKYIHRLVAETFIPNPENKPCIDHINGRKLDNRANNLRWVTYKENNNYAQQNGLWKTVTFNKKPVKCIETGEVFESATAAARWIHKQISTSKTESIMKNIKACCYGKQSTAYKYHWEHLQ